MGRGSLAWPDPNFFLHAEGKVGSGQLTLSRLFRFPKIIGGVSGSAIATFYCCLTALSKPRGSRVMIPMEGT